MPNLKEILKPKTAKNISSKTPKFYNEEKNHFIVECSTSKETKVRMFAATNSHIPTKILSGMLEVEKDKQVMRAILMNDKLPRKSVAKFVSNDLDERVEWFNDDTDLIERFKQE